MTIPEIEIKYVYERALITEKDLEEIKKICEALQNIATLRIKAKSQRSVTSQK